MRLRKLLPTQADLLAKLDYDPLTGTLVWLPRPASFFLNPAYAGRWNDLFANQEAFTAVSDTGYRVGGFLGDTFAAHRIIWKMVYGYDPDTIDHIDGNRQNNRIENLRDTTQSGNMKNTKIGESNTSGHLGVYWRKDRSTWVAQINIEGRVTNLGSFKRIADAVSARKTAEREQGYHPNHGR